MDRALILAGLLVLAARAEAHDTWLLPESFELYIAGTNLLNRTNPLSYSGVMTSRFFGEPTSALPARRLELGARFGF